MKELERFVHLVLGTATLVRLGDRRALARSDERGLSQSTENVILLVGAVTIAVIVIGLVTTWVRNHLVLTAP